MRLIGLIMCFVVSAFADPNVVEPRNIQMHATQDRFIFIEEWSPRVVVYRSTDPNLCNDFSWTVKNEKVYVLNSSEGLKYLAQRWSYFMQNRTAMINLGILSQHWVAVVKPEVIEPNVPEIVVVEPNIVDPNNVVAELMVWVSESGGKYHTETCRYAKTAKPVFIIDALNSGYEPCSVCKPTFSE